jgi:hypothetical protein
VNQNQVLVPERHRHQTSNHHFPPTRNWREKMNEGMWNFNIEKVNMRVYCLPFVMALEDVQKEE